MEPVELWCFHVGRSSLCAPRNSAKKWAELTGVRPRGVLIKRSWTQLGGEERNTVSHLMGLLAIVPSSNALVTSSFLLLLVRHLLLLAWHLLLLVLGVFYFYFASVHGSGRIRSMGGLFQRAGVSHDFSFSNGDRI